MINTVGIVLIFSLAFAFPVYLLVREISKKRTLNIAAPICFRDLTSDEKSYLRSQKPLVFLISQNYQKDSTEKVWKIKGNVFKETIKAGASYTYIITIGKVEFNLINSQSETFMKDFDKIQQGEIISIQYSPFSKHIWRIDK